MRVAEDAWAIPEPFDAQSMMAALVVQAAVRARDLSIAQPELPIGVTRTASGGYAYDWGGKKPNGD